MSVSPCTIVALKLTLLSRL